MTTEPIPAPEAAYRDRLIVIAAWTILLGALLSGPVSTGLLMLFSPQPPWTDAATFIHAYHPVQALPFLLGFVLLAGTALLVVPAGRAARSEEESVQSQLALVALTIYATLVTLNYTIQAAYVPSLARLADLSVDSWTMTNPNSLSWAIEMFAYLFQGIAFWLVAWAFTGGRADVWAKVMILLNLVLSIGGAVAACINVGWAMTPFGLFMFVAWNLVLVALMAAIIVNRSARHENVSAFPTAQPRA